VRRAQLLIVYDREAVLAVVGVLQPATLIVDVQPFVASWGCSSDAIFPSAVALSKYFADATSSLRIVVFSTNARPAFHQQLQRGRPQVTFVSRARKPWSTTYLVDAPRPILVLGDQILTDGLLAFRLGGDFLHWRASGQIPWWPRLQTIIGAPAAKLMFSPMDPYISSSGVTGSSQ
jgi:hypothetical protein